MRRSSSSRRLEWRWLAAGSIWLLTAALLQALPVPPAPTQWITDQAGLLSSDARQRLNAKLREFEQRTGNQFIVYILPSLEGDSLEDFTIRAAEAWKVGRKKYDNGLILFVFSGDQKLRFEVGYGLEPVITDAFASRVLRQVIAPRFSRGQFEAGLEAAIDQVTARIEGKAPPQADEGEGLVPRERKTGFNDIWPLLVIFFIFFFVLGPLLRRGGCGCLPLLFLPGGGRGTTFGGGGFGGFSGGGGFGGFSGGGGGFGGGGASGGW